MSNLFLLHLLGDLPVLVELGLHFLLLSLGLPLVLGHVELLVSGLVISLEDIIVEATVRALELVLKEIKHEVVSLSIVQRLILFGIIHMRDDIILTEVSRGIEHVALVTIVLLRHLIALED